LAQALPTGGALRLDANGAWDRETAGRFVAGLAELTIDGLPIDALEEPLAEPVDQDLAALQNAAPFAIALDESLARRPGLLDAT
jgi:L-alanine-DL-glutamate epimerase-like enolase superfamily enzyme